MAQISAAQSGYWDEGATWVGGVAPGASDVGVINNNAYTVTVRNNTTSAFSASRGTLVINDGVTFTYGGDCSYGSTTYAYMSSVVVGSGVTLDQGAFNSLAGQCSISVNGAEQSVTKITGSGSWGFASGLQHRKSYNWKYVSCQLTGDIDVRSGSGDTNPTIRETSFNNVVFSGYSSFSCGTYSGTYDLKFENIRFDGNGDIRIARQNAEIETSTIFNNIVADSDIRRIVYLDYLGLSEGKFEDCMFRNHKIQENSASALSDFDGLFIYDDTAPEGNLWIIGGNGNKTPTRMYMACPNTLDNPHVFNFGNADISDCISEIDFSNVSNDDGDIFLNKTGKNVSLTRCLSIRSSGMLANVGVASGSVVLDHCTGRYNKGLTSGDHLVKFENVWSPYSASLTVKNSLLYADDGGTDYIVGRVGGSTDPIAITSINNCATNHADAVLEPGQNMTATEADNQYGVDPQFLDDTRNLASYGGLSHMLSADGYNSTTKWFTDTPSGASIDGLIDYVKAGFAPTNTALQGAADDAGDIGAVAVGAAPSPSEGIDLIPVNTQIIDLVTIDLVQ